MDREKLAKFTILKSGPNIIILDELKNRGIIEGYEEINNYIDFTISKENVPMAIDTIASILIDMKIAHTPDYARAIAYSFFINRVK